jgi:outer membrane protein
VKRKMLVMAAMAALGVAIYLGTQLWAQQPGQPMRAPTPASPKIGMVNVIYLVKGYHKYAVNNVEIEKINKQYDEKSKPMEKAIKDWQVVGSDPKSSQADREKAEEAIRSWKRNYDDLVNEYKKVVGKKKDEQMVQLYKEIEQAVQTYAVANGFHLILHYSDALSEADKNSAMNIQRKLIMPGNAGALAPLYIANCMDVSNDVLNNLNAANPAPVAAVPGAAQPKQ